MKNKKEAKDKLSKKVPASSITKQTFSTKFTSTSQTLP